MTRIRHNPQCCEWELVFESRICGNGGFHVHCNSTSGKSHLHFVVGIAHGCNGAGNVSVNLTWYRRPEPIKPFAVRMVSPVTSHDRPGHDTRAGFEFGR